MKNLKTSETSQSKYGCWGYTKSRNKVQNNDNLPKQNEKHIKTPNSRQIVPYSRNLGSRTRMSFLSHSPLKVFRVKFNFAVFPFRYWRFLYYACSPLRIPFLVAPYKIIVFLCPSFFFKLTFYHLDLQ